MGGGTGAGEPQSVCILVFPGVLLFGPLCAALLMSPLSECLCPASGRQGGKKRRLDRGA